jgi:hypothetical protein
MEPRTLSMIQSAGRMAFGAAFLAAPGFAARGWIGSDADRAGAQVMTQAMGARDFGMGVGQLLATRDGRGVGGWLTAGIIADLADLVATMRARDRVPASGVAGVAVFATTSILLGAWLSRELD